MVTLPLSLAKTRNRSPAHHNLNNQQLKLLQEESSNQAHIPAHHNLNNQQLKPWNLKT